MRDENYLLIALWLLVSLCIGVVSIKYCWYLEEGAMCWGSYWSVPQTNVYVYDFYLDRIEVYSASWEAEVYGRGAPSRIENRTTLSWDLWEGYHLAKLYKITFFLIVFLIIVCIIATILSIVCYFQKKECLRKLFLISIIIWILLAISIPVYFAIQHPRAYRKDLPIVPDYPGPWMNFGIAGNSYSEHEGGSFDRFSLHWRPDTGWFFAVVNAVIASFFGITYSYFLKKTIGEKNE